MDSLSSLPPVPDPRINPLIYYSISPDAAQWQLEHINDSKAGDILASLVVGFVLAYLAVTLRFVARRMKRTPYHIDDWLIVKLYLHNYPNFTELIIETGAGGRSAHRLLHSGLPWLDKIQCGQTRHIDDESRGTGKG